MSGEKENLCRTFFCAGHFVQFHHAGHFVRIFEIFAGHVWRDQRISRTLWRWRSKFPCRFAPLIRYYTWFDQTCRASELGLQFQEIPLSRGPIDHRTILTMQLQQKVQFSLVGEDWIFPVMRFLMDFLVFSHGDLPARGDVGIML